MSADLQMYQPVVTSLALQGRREVVYIFFIKINYVGQYAGLYLVLFSFFFCNSPIEHAEKNYARFQFTHRDDIVYLLLLENTICAMHRSASYVTLYSQNGQLIANILMFLQFKF